MRFSHKNHIASLLFSLCTSWIYIKDTLKTPEVCYEKNYLIFLTPVLTSLIYIFFLPEKNGDSYYIKCKFVKKGDKKVGNKYDFRKAKVKDSSFDFSQNTGVEKEESLFKKWSFWLSVFGFVYFCLVLFAAYDLQNGGKLGNKTFERIVLAPIPLLKTDDKK